MRNASLIHPVTVGVLGIMALVAMGAGTASAQEKIIKVILPVPTVDIPDTGGWRRTGTVIRNLYPQVDPDVGLQTDSGSAVTVTLTIESSDLVFSNDQKTMQVTILAGKASKPFWVKVEPGGTWHAGEQVTVTGVPAPGSGYDRVVQIPANVKPAQILSQLDLDIDPDGVPDGAPDSDGDGLPDNWEQGGYKTWLETVEEVDSDRVVKFSAPTAIGPGTPPVFVLIRQAVATSATSYDSDGDGLSDFVEVFGLKYIDRDGNGVLDANEWNDGNGDGLPSIGENPIRDDDPSRNLERNFAGFMFTDPSYGDTDRDTLLDSEDPEPLINPNTFGVDRGNFTRVGAPGDADLDNDGLGNGADFGNDLLEEDKGKVDSPPDLPRLLSIFRSDLYKSPIYDGDTVIPESLIEDLIGADWDGNGLYRLTDVRNFHVEVSESILTGLVGGESRFHEFFYVGATPLFHPRTAASPRKTGGQEPYGKTMYGEQHLGLGVQDLLLPDQPSRPFLPDVRVWTILYAWRVPGFDIDGNGYVGSPDGKFLLDDVHVVPGGSLFDGRVEPLFRCGDIGIFGLVSLILGFTAAKVTIPRVRRRGR